MSDTTMPSDEELRHIIEEAISFAIQGTQEYAQQDMQDYYTNRTKWIKLEASDILKSFAKALHEAEVRAQEIFIPVRGAEGLYEVSNTGKIRSVLGGRRKGVELKQSLRNKAANKTYYIVSLVINGRPKTVTVHRLVAKAFISNPNEKPCVNHIDGNRLNNDVGNLEWVTYQENEQHAFEKLGKISWNKGRKGIPANKPRIATLTAEKEKKV